MIIIPQNQYYLHHVSASYGKDDRIEIDYDINPILAFRSRKNYDDETEYRPIYLDHDLGRVIEDIDIEDDITLEHGYYHLDKIHTANLPLDEYRVCAVARLCKNDSATFNKWRTEYLESNRV